MVRYFDSHRLPGSGKAGYAGDDDHCPEDRTILPERISEEKNGKKLTQALPAKRPDLSIRSFLYGSMSIVGVEPKTK